MRMNEEREKKLRAKIEKLSREQLIEQLFKFREAVEMEYIPVCEKCGSVKIVVYINEDYFSEPLRYNCKNCGKEWGD